MKKVVSLLLIFLVLFFIGCEKESFRKESKDPTKGDFIYLSNRNISMYHNNGVQLSLNYGNEESKNLKYTFTSSDTFVINTLEDGIVYGISIGEAYVTVVSENEKYRDTCFFTIEPKADTYREPLKINGSTLEQIKQYEKREIISESNDIIEYKGENPKVYSIKYYLDSNGLKEVCIEILKHPDYENERENEIFTFLLERYQFVSNHINQYNFKDRRNNNEMELNLISPFISTMIQVKYILKSN